MSGNEDEHDEYRPQGEMKSSLDLESIAPMPPMDLMEDGAASGRFLQQGLNDISVREIAKFGDPGSGVIGSLRYWLRVHTRLKELAIEHDQALEKSRAAMVDKNDGYARLGRKANELRITGDSLEPLISRASTAEADLKGTEQRRSSLESEHQEKASPIEAKLKQIEAEAVPLHQKESQINEELTNLQKDRKRTETKMKRFEIDLRNMEELISKRQESYADTNRPKEERDKLLVEIAAFDKRRPGLIEQVEACQKEIAEMSGPIEAIEAQLNEVKESIRDKQEKIDALKSELNVLSRSHSEADGAVTRQMESEKEKVEESWASVGERIIAEHVDEPELEKLKSKVLSTITGASEAERKAELLSKAQTCYDHDVITFAKRIAGAAVAAIVGIIALLIFLV